MTRDKWKIIHWGNERISKRTEERDLDVNITDKLPPEKHITKIRGETYNLLRNIRTAFTHLDEEMIKKLIVTMICSRLKYAAVV